MKVFSDLESNGRLFWVYELFCILLEFSRIKDGNPSVYFFIKPL